MMREHEGGGTLEHISGVHSIRSHSLFNFILAGGWRYVSAEQQRLTAGCCLGTPQGKLHWSSNSVLGSKKPLLLNTARG